MSKRCIKCGKKVYRASRYCEEHYEEVKARKRKVMIPLRELWYTMVGKCTKEHWKIYQNYGARGYTVCKEWMDKDNFTSWAIQQGYQKYDKLVLEEGKLEYSPSNCYIRKKK